MKVNYTEPFNFKPIPCITPLDNYWQNGTWKFGSLEITPDTAYQPSFIDIILKGNTALTLVNSKANSLQYLKLYGGCSQASTPTPSNPKDIICNNGALTMVDDELPSGYKRVLGYTCDNNALWQITNFHLRGSDTVRISFSVTAACNVFGCYQSTSATDNYDLYASTSSGSKYFRYDSGAYLSYFATNNLNKRFDVVYTPTGSQGMPQDSTWTPETFEAENDLLIGATTLTGTSAKLKGNLYGNFEVDGRLKLIPCERLSDNSLGYYDTYSETFFEPIGTPTSMGYDSSHYVLTVDGTTETVNVTGKNSFDMDWLLEAQGWTKEGNIYSGETTYLYNKYKIQNGGFPITFIPNTQYTFSATIGSNNGNARFEFIYTDNTYTNIRCTANQNITVTSTSGKTLKMVSFNYGSNGTFEVSNIQVELGTTATTYEPYYNGGTATATDLLAVGTYKDIQEVLTGDVTRNVGVYVFDGTEGWSATGDTYGVTLKQADYGYVDNVPVICSHFAYSSNSSTTLTDVICNRSGNFGLRILANSTIMPNAATPQNRVADFKTWLADQYANGTPVIVVYPLDTATTESVTPQSLNIQAGTNIIEITQASIDGLELEVKYKAGVEVTIEEVENAQLDNNVEVTIQ